MKSIGTIVVLAGLSLVFFFGLMTPSMTLATTTTPTPGAGGLIPCAGPDCHFSDIILFANTIIGWLLRIAIPVSAALFSYAGFLYLTSEGNPGKKSAANKVFQSVFWGFIMALSAWILVNFLTNFFLNKDADEVLSLISPSTVIISSYELL
ncbi:MAG: hypothetical protein QG633_489 [Patescibacteria group bacterium]|nr:hypothetical protein [Patescibacteria group bacterium]